MKENKWLISIYLIIVFIAYFMCFVVIKETGNGNRTLEYEINRIIQNYSYKQIIRYYTIDKDIYELIRENDRFKVVKKKLLDCDTIRCPEEYVSEYEVHLSDSALREEYIFYNNFFQSEEQVIKLDYDDYRLTDYRMDHINALIYQDDEYLKYYIVPLNYELVNDYYGNLRVRGFYVKEVENDGVYVVIGMGEKNTGGYSIDLDNLLLNQYTNELTIYVTESSPDFGAMVTQALTYPTIKIKLSYKPKSIKVINKDNNSEFQELREG